MPRTRARRGGLSIPLSHIIVFVVILAAAGFLAYHFIGFGQNAGKVAVLSAVGQPVAIYDANAGTTTIHATLKNDGTVNATIQKILIDGVQATLTAPADGIIPAGGSVAIEASATYTPANGIVEVVVVTDQGTINFKATVVNG